MKSFSFALTICLTLSVVGCSAGNKPEHYRQAPAAQPAKQKIASVSSLVAGLEARLEQEPDDAKGWLLLAKSYWHLGRAEDARDAYGKASALGQADDRLAAEIFGMSPTAAARLLGEFNAPDGPTR